MASPERRTELGENARRYVEENHGPDQTYEPLAELLDSCHQSLRDDYEVSTPVIEDVVARARASGARGARLMGGGFGGSVLALVEAARVADFRAALDAPVTICRPAAGAFAPP